MDRKEQQPVKFHMRIDTVAGVLLSALALLIWYGSAPLPVGELSYFGSGFMPRICAAALLIGGMSLLFRGITQPSSDAEQLVLVMRGPIFVGCAILVFALTIKGYAIGPLTIPQLGLVVAGPLSIFISGFGSVEARPRELIVLALGLTGLGTLVFVDLLSVALPTLPSFIERSLPPSWGIDWPPRIVALVLLAAAAGLAWYFRTASGSHSDNTGAGQ